MTDIVERLRDIEMSNGQQVTPFMMMTARKAAAEIERLRAQSRWLQRDFPSADALEAARRILDSVAEMKGKKLAVAFGDEQTASHVSFIIENAATVSRALLQAEEKTKR